VRVAHRLALRQAQAQQVAATERPDEVEALPRLVRRE